MTFLEAAAIYAGINILILLVLAVRVPGARTKHRVSLGDGGNPEVLRAVRAHGNAAEYIPAGIVGLTLLALFDPAVPPWLFHACGLTLTIGRAAHAVGLSAGEMNIGRMAGTLLTFIAYVLIGGALIWAGLSRPL